MNWREVLALGRPAHRKVGALLTVSARGLALGKRLVEGAFHLPRVQSYSPAFGFVPRLGDFFCCMLCSFSLVVIRLP